MRLFPQKRNSLQQTILGEYFGCRDRPIQEEEQQYEQIPCLASVIIDILFVSDCRQLVGTDATSR
jgi:hypothetical protein